MSDSAWQPRSGSAVNHRALTAAMIDSRDFVAAQRRAETEVHAPAGARIAAGWADNRKVPQVLFKPDWTPA